MAPPAPDHSPPPYSHSALPLPSELRSRTSHRPASTASSSTTTSTTTSTAVATPQLSKTARERLVLPHLPPPPTDARRPKPIRAFVGRQFHKLVLVVIHLLWSLYLRARWAYSNIKNRTLSVLYYHHRTPQLIQKDVRDLAERGKLPRHLSVILDYERRDLDSLIDEFAEIACWCASAGIPKLSVYERSGVLKAYISTSHRAVAQRLRSYFGRARPSVRVWAPHSSPYANSDVPADADDQRVDLEIVVISEEDGRESLVDLTKTLCEMAQRGKITADDVSVDLVDAEVKENTMDEPDLLILFSPEICLKGYPPWPLRLTEIYNVQDNSSVGYQVFLRALHSFANTEFRFGR